MSAIAEFRQQFPTLSHQRYFNYGGQGPMARSTLDAIHQAQEQIQLLGPFSGAAGRWVVGEGRQIRQTIATELGVQAATITLTENVSVGCNIALWGMDWQPGDHLLLSDCEHPGIVAIVLELQRRLGVQVSTFPLLATLNQGDPIAVMQQHLQPHTRLVVVSHVLWNTGQVLPLKELVAVCHCHSPRVQVLVDAAQSVGMLPLDLAATEVDFYAFTGHKWWCGPGGLGGLYVSPGAELSPTFVSWRSITKDAAGYPTGWQATGERFEVATANYPLYAGLRTAIALHGTQGSATERYQKICALSRTLWEQLSQIPGIHCLQKQPPESGLVSFQMAPPPSTAIESSKVAVLHDRLVQSLESQQILVRTILQPNCVRACVHYFTTLEEIEQLVARVAQFSP